MTYFSHDINARNDYKILQLRSKFGLEGYGLYFGIIEIMYSEPNFALAYDDELYAAIEYDLRPKVDVKEFIDYCLKVGLLTTDGDMIWSDSLNRRATVAETKVSKRKESATTAAKKRWQDKEDEQAVEEPLTPQTVDPEWAKVVSAWESNGLGNMPNPETKSGSDLDSYYAEMGADVIVYAVGLSANKSVNYLLAILRSWSEAGIKSVDDAKAEQVRRKTMNTPISPQRATRNPLDDAKFF